MKLLHLVLFSNDENYTNMYLLTREYYKLFKNVKTFYYKHHNNNDDNCVEVDSISGDILLLKGREKSHVPVDKTLQAMNIFDCNEYDYVIRSNISTIVNFDLLINYLSKNVIEYGGGHIFNLTWTDPQYGIVDHSYYGTNYVSGTCIILSKNIVKKIKENSNQLIQTIVDDVAIGVFLKDVPITNIGNFYTVGKLNGNYKQIQNNVHNTIFYRNRNIPREIDVIQMREIINILKTNRGMNLRVMNLY